MADLHLSASSSSSDDNEQTDCISLHRSPYSARKRPHSSNSGDLPTKLSKNDNSINCIHDNKQNVRSSHHKSPSQKGHHSGNSDDLPTKLSKSDNSINRIYDNKQNVRSSHHKSPARKRHYSGSSDDLPTKASKSDNSINHMPELESYSNISKQLMSKMGYKPGMGLGKDSKGRADNIPLSTQRGRRGLGLTIKTETSDVIVDWREEKPPSADEVIEWMSSYDEAIPNPEELEDWEETGKRKLTIEDETLFCDKEILERVLACKSIFDDLEGQEMRNARMRSNPYETIKGGIFLNRAAMKMANMDACFGFMFTNPKNLQSNELLYFADICAGPGGFSEYVLWRKKWRAKGFGFTLKGDNDFKLETFYAAHPEFFETHYGKNGKDGDGDIMKSENIEEFQKFVLDSTDEKGVHFVMADGDFSVEGQENIQEILTKQLLLCQFACALSIVRKDGHFICKTFDLFTPFSVGLIYLLRIAFRRVSLFKPVTSRPANSERYVVCEDFRDTDRIIYQYLMDVNDDLNNLHDKDEDIKAVVYIEDILKDTDFFQYVKSSNERIATEQCKSLSKIHAFTKDRNLMDTRQADVREACLKRWDVPDQMRKAPPRVDASTLFHRLTGLDDPSSWLKNAPLPLNHKTLTNLERVYDYRCIVSGSRSTIIISLGGARIFRWNDRTKKWNSLNEVRCRIPRETILDVEIVSELKGEGKGQHRVHAIHVVDAMVLAGENLMAKNFNERVQCASMFVKAISQPTCPNLNVIRMKEIFRLEEIETIFTRLSMKLVKGGGFVERPCFEIPTTQLAYIPSGLTFIKFIKDPWSMAFSKSQQRKYFFNCTTRQSVYECPVDSIASYETCSQSRLFWKWDEKVKVHPAQHHQHNDLISCDQLIEFIQLSIHK